jgi:thiol:disulfide interchange protein DsbC
MFCRPLSALALLVSLSACAAEPPPPAPAAKAAPVAAAAASTSPDAVVRAALTSLLPNVQITHVVAAPIPGFREVAMDGRILYVSDDGRFLMQGALIDVERRDNLTQVS